MDLTMSLAAMSTSLAQNKVMQQAAISVAKKAMDAQEIQMQGIVEMMGGTPSFGHALDIRV